MICLKSVNYSYRRREGLFDALSVDFDDGHVHGLLGSNGAGKTTLMSLAAGLLFAHGGSVEVDGKDPSLRQPQLLSDLLFVPEELSLPSMSIERYARLTAPFYTRFAAADFDRCCHSLGVDRLKNLRRMSMGERKKAYIAFALACNCRNLLFDEPTNGLDIPSKAVFRELVAGYAADDRTVVVSTHQVREVENLIDSVVMIDRAGLVLSATTEQIARRLRFSLYRKGDQLLYSEQSVEGIRGVAKNDTDQESVVDLELLFQAANVQRATIVELFNTASNDENA